MIFPRKTRILRDNLDSIWCQSLHAWHSGIPDGFSLLSLQQSLAPSKVSGVTSNHFPPTFFNWNCLRILQILSFPSSPSLSHPQVLRQRSFAELAGSRRERMEGNVDMSRGNEDYTLAEVGQQIDITVNTEEIPSEHDNTAEVYQNSESVASSVESEQAAIQVANTRFSFPNSTATVTLTTSTDGTQPPSVLQQIPTTLGPIQSEALRVAGLEAAASLSQISQGIIQADDVKSCEGPVATVSVPVSQAAQARAKWQEAMNSDVLLIRCRDETAELHKNKLGSGGRGKCIKVKQLSGFTPCDSNYLPLVWFSVKPFVKHDDMPVLAD